MSICDHLCMSRSVFIDMLWNLLKPGSLKDPEEQRQSLRGGFSRDYALWKLIQDTKMYENAKIYKIKISYMW